MTKVLIEEAYRVTLPLEVQELVPVGAAVWVTVDEAGRIILTPESRVQAILMETYGMWADRDDLPADGITYVDEIRQGQRLDNLNLIPDEIN